MTTRASTVWTYVIFWCASAPNMTYTHVHLVGLKTYSYSGFAVSTFSTYRAIFLLVVNSTASRRLVNFLDLILLTTLLSRSPIPFR